MPSLSIPRRRWKVKKRCTWRSKPVPLRGFFCHLEVSQCMFCTRDLRALLSIASSSASVRISCWDCWAWCRSCCLQCHCHALSRGLYNMASNILHAIMWCWEVFLEVPLVCRPFQVILERCVNIRGEKARLYQCICVWKVNGKKGSSVNLRKAQATQSRCLNLFFKNKDIRVSSRDIPHIRMNFKLVRKMNLSKQIKNCFRELIVPALTFHTGETPTLQHM